MLKVRPVVYEDIDPVLVLARAMHAESPRYSGHEFVEEKAVMLIARLMESGGGFVAEQDGVIVGMVGGVIVEHFFSHDKYAGDLVLYVVPAARGSSAAVRLVHAFEEWARANSVPEVSLGVSTAVTPERTVCVYERLGYRLYSYSLLKRF